MHPLNRRGVVGKLQNPRRPRQLQEGYMPPLTKLLVASIGEEEEESLHIFQPTQG